MYISAVPWSLPVLLLACSGPSWFPQEPSALPDDPWDDETGFNEDALPCSTSNPNPAELLVQNRSGAAVDLWWRDASCAETWLAAIPPDADQPVGTWWDAAFVVRLPDSGEVVDWFVVRANQQTEVIE